ncbi:MAG TPA: RNA polymerase sigma factor [Polyangiaceae bacterium]|nr:RNA polymerase sigma factor [Polyangiaceae bacterium]
MDVEECVDDEASLGVLFARHAPSLRRMLSRRRGSAPVGTRALDKDLDDLVPDTFLSVLLCTRRVPSLRVTPAYLFTVARNLCIDRWWRRGKSVCVELGGSDAAAVFPEEFESECDRRERAEALARYVEQLPPSLLSIYEARFVRGLSQRDAAADLGISRGQLRSLEQCLFSGAMSELVRTT